MRLCMYADKNFPLTTNSTPCSGPGVRLPEEQAGRPSDERPEVELHQVPGLARGRCCEEVRAELTSQCSALRGSIGIAFSAEFLHSLSSPSIRLIHVKLQHECG